MIPGLTRMAALVRERDWSQHELGSIETWPAALRAALTTCFAARSPMQVWWGPNALLFYNDAFIPWLDGSHPASLGERASVVFGARWHRLAEGLQSVHRDRGAMRVGSLVLLPIAGERGDVEGVVCSLAPDAFEDDYLTAFREALRTPLDTASTPELATHVDQLTRVIDDVFDLSRVSRGVLRLQRDAVEAGEPVQSAILLASPFARDHGAYITSHLHFTAAIPHIAVDAPRIARALAHLLIEATCRATELRVDVRPSDGGGVRIFITCGHPRPRRLDVKVPFAKGVLLANHLIELHGGSVDDRASEIIVELPIGDVWRVPVVAEPEPAKRVLLVEDDDATSHMLQIALEHNGYTVALAHNAPIALQLVTMFDPDLVLVDIGLPVVDGWELGGLLHERFPDLPVIAVTGRNAESDREQSRRMGFLEHLTKPVNMAELRRTLERAVRPAQLASEE